MPQESQEVQEVLRQPKSMSVTSPAFAHGGRIPREFSGKGDDVSPPLSWEGVPEAARALALVVDDPDAPRGTFTHWTVWNLPADKRSLPQEAHVASDGAVEGTNDFGRVGWNGPLPPSGTHRYFVRVFALREPLALEEGAEPAEVWAALRGKTLAWGETMGTFTAT